MVHLSVHVEGLLGFQRPRKKQSSSTTTLSTVYEEEEEDGGGGGGGLGRRARDLQGYIVLWLMARAMMVNGFTTVRTQPAFFSLTKNETKRRRKKCFLQIFFFYTKGKVSICLYFL